VPFDLSFTVIIGIVLESGSTAADSEFVLHSRYGTWW